MEVAIIGGGPAGLRAAEVAIERGAQVTIFDAKPSVGRKFLVAGRGGLNLTKAEPVAAFTAHYLGDETMGERWTTLIGDFDSAAIRGWAAGLGIETFVASTGRVYPRELKAAPLLRRWVERLRRSGCAFAMHHRWTGLRLGSRLGLTFDTPAGPVSRESDAVVLALGGGSWPETGSDGRWTGLLESLGVEVAPLQPANCGWEVKWPAEVLAAAEGRPLKSVSVRVGDREVRGELLVTRYGLEGGAIYQLGPALRAQAAPSIRIDFKPASSAERLVARMGPITRNFLPEARQRLRLDEACAAILTQFGGAETWRTAADVAAAVKSCAIPLEGPRPIDEAISSAGGVRWEGLDERLMLRSLPGVFVAGEMIDWGAPTGGYLLQGCFATGTRAGRAAAAFRRE